MLKKPKKINNEVNGAFIERFFNFTDNISL